MKDKNTDKKSKYKVVNIIFWIVLAVVAIYAVFALTSTDDGVTSIFGNTAFTVQTNSMSPTFDKGDLIYVNTDINPEDIKVGDVITYSAYIDVNADGESEWVYNSHRVISITISGNGLLYFETQGDNNNSPDNGNVFQDEIVGVWTGKVIRNLGGIIDGIVGFLKSGTGFFIFIVIPCFAFLVYEVVRFVGVMTEYKTQQVLADRVKISEEALAAARAQLEAEAVAQKQQENNNEEREKDKADKKE